MNCYEESHCNSQVTAIVFQVKETGKAILPFPVHMYLRGLT